MPCEAGPDFPQVPSYVVSHNLHKDPIRGTAVIPIIRMGKPRPPRVSDMPKVTYLEGGSSRTRAQLCPLGGLRSCSV